MSTAYQPFPITEFKTGIFTYTEPWTRPADAFEPLVNAYVYRGTISKRAGYSQFGNTLADANPVMGIMQYINEATGLPSLVVGTTQNLYLYDTGTSTFSALTTGGQANLFTGNISQFFNYTNWTASASATSYMYMTNSKDPITRYDGVTTITQPTLAADASNNITTCLDIKVYKNRLLAIRPTLSTDGVQNQSIYWSAISNPTNFLNTTTGNGGFLAAPTGEIIQSAEFVRDVLIIFFTNSTWIFRYTGNDFAPFRFDRIGVTKNTNAPYASVQYDDRVTSIGSTGFIACDGTTVQRYDLPIIDYYETNFLERYYSQAFSQRYDNLQQTWTLYVSSQTNTTDFPLIGGVAPGSDKAVIYNFLENTWATYSFPIPMTCLGLFYKVSGTTWALLPQAWEDTDQSWDSYYDQSRAPILLGGDTSGHVWHMDNGEEVTDKEVISTVVTDVEIVPDIVSTRWNPLIQSAQKVQFGYIDIYYRIASMPDGTDISVTLNFFVDNSENVAVSKTLTLDGPINSQFTFKRIYVNVIGQFIQMEIDPDVNSFMQFLGFILWVRPAGRFTGP